VILVKMRQRYEADIVRLEADLHELVDQSSLHGKATTELGLAAEQQGEFVAVAGTLPHL
jgi:hypothetical protein